MATEVRYCFLFTHVQKETNSHEFFFESDFLSRKLPTITINVDNADVQQTTLIIKEYLRGLGIVLEEKIPNNKIRLFQIVVDRKIFHVYNIDCDDQEAAFISAITQCENYTKCWNTECLVGDHLAKAVIAKYFVDFYIRQWKVNQTK